MNCSGGYFVGTPAREMERYNRRCISTARRYRGTLVYGAQGHRLR